MCKTCNGTGIVHPEVMQGISVVQPCPNCTSGIHDHYENELEELKHGDYRQAQA